jgi:predicted ATP-grasp superfamily ATP-dependent carboligase
MDHSRQHAAHSRYANMHDCPHPVTHPHGFIAAVRALAIQLPEKPVLLMAADEYIGAVAQHREELGEIARFNFPQPGLLARIVDKAEQMVLAEEAGVAVPLTQVVSNEDECEIALARIPLPAFIKGRSAVSWRGAFGSTVKGLTVNSRTEMRDVLQKVLAHGISAVVQDIIPGDARQHQKVSAYVSSSGEILAAFTLRKLRQNPPGFGFGCLVETIDNPELLKMGTELFQRIGYRGTGSAEFKFDARDGRYKLIELNPRYWQQNALAEQVGMNFPLLEYRDVCGLVVEPVREFRKGVKWISFGADFEKVRILWDRGDISLPQWLASLRGELCWSDFSADDLGPGVWVMRQALKIRLRRPARALGARRGR